MRHGSAVHDPFQRGAAWRGAVGCIVAYTLVIAALLSGVLQAEWFAQSAAGLVGERCLTDARAAGVDPAVPAGQPDDSVHCALCTPAAGSAVLPAAPSPAFIVLPRAAAPAGGSDHDLIHSPGHPGKLPRGPPRPAAQA